MSSEQVIREDFFEIVEVGVLQVRYCCLSETGFQGKFQLTLAGQTDTEARGRRNLLPLVTCI